MSDRLTLEDGALAAIPPVGALPAQCHVFEHDSIDAVNAALAARRPLLVRGEPGTGKSQLAHAAAIGLGRVFLAKVVDVRTEPRDLLWRFDAVARLAQAQVVGALPGIDRAALEQEMREQRYVRPGPLWWAFDWPSALAQAPGEAPPTPDRWKPKDGAVVLIDEIDKASSDVPNGLLEALGSGAFSPPGFDRPIAADATTPPLVVVTTNEERALPDAFLRRCLVLHLALPSARSELTELLVARGEAHFPSSSEAVRQRAAELLIEDRQELRDRGLSAPGQAEYLDLLRAVLDLADGTKEQLALIERLRRYTYAKHPPESEA